MYKVNINTDKSRISSVLEVVEMTVEAKFTTAGMTRGKRYDVIEVGKYINAYKIVLDDGTVAFRHKCGFKIINKNER